MSNRVQISEKKAILSINEACQEIEKRDNLVGFSYNTQNMKATFHSKIENKGLVYKEQARYKRKGTKLSRGKTCFTNAFEWHILVVKTRHSNVDLTAYYKVKKQQKKQVVKKTTIGNNNNNNNNNFLFHRQLLIPSSRTSTPANKPLQPTTRKEEKGVVVNDLTLEQSSYNGSNTTTTTTTTQNKEPVGNNIKKRKRSNPSLSLSPSPSSSSSTSLLSTSIPNNNNNSNNKHVHKYKPWHIQWQMVVLEKWFIPCGVNVDVLNTINARHCFDERW